MDTHDGSTPVELEIEQIADGVIFRPYGEIDLRRAPWLRESLAEVQDQHPARLVIDLSEVEHIDSSVVAVLVIALRAARLHSCNLILCNLQYKVRSLLEITRLHQGTFTVVDTLDEAVGLDNRRKFQRFRAATLRCDVGEILDISATGVRIHCKRRPRGIMRIKLRDGDTVIPIEADVVWAKRQGFRRYEAGLRFVKLTAETARRLGELIHKISQQKLKAA